MDAVSRKGRGREREREKEKEFIMVFVKSGKLRVDAIDVVE